MIITYMSYGAELRLTALLLRLGFEYGRDVVRSPTQPGDVRGTTTITAALTGCEISPLPDGAPRCYTGHNDRVVGISRSAVAVERRP